MKMTFFLCSACKNKQEQEKIWAFTKQCIKRSLLLIFFCVHLYFNKRTKQNIFYEE